MSDVLERAAANWPEVAVSEVSELIRGVTYSKEHATDKPKDGYTPVLRATNIQDSELVLESDLVFVPDSNVSAAQRLRAGDIVVATSSGSKHLVGKSGHMHTDWPGAFGAFCAAIRPKANIESRYLAAFLQSPSYWKQVGKKSLGVNINNLRRGDIESLTLPLPPLEKQREIVDEIEKQFSRLDEAVACLQRVKANLNRYKASVLTAALEGRLVQTEADIARREGRSYETGQQLLQRILEARRSEWKARGKYKEPSLPNTDGLSELPEGWTWARLDSVAALKGGITVDSKRVDPSARSVPYLRVANVQRGYLDLSEMKEISARNVDIDELRLQQGDILFNEGGDRDKLGRGWIWESQIPECIHQNHVFRARVFLQELSPKLVSWWGNTFGKDYFSRQGKQTTNLASINIIKLSEFPVPIPPVVEQRRIVSELDRLLSIVREVEAEVDANLQRAKSLRQSVLQRAFSGDIVSHLDEAKAEIEAITLNTANSSRMEFAPVVIAAKIMAANCGAPTFGRVKLQKMIYVATYHGKVEATNDEFARKQAGPLDMAMLEGVIKRLNELHWFRESVAVGKLPGDKSYTYSALTKAEEYKRHLSVLTPDQVKVVDDLNKLMRRWPTEDCELFATVYAAWNDLLLWKHEPTGDAIAEQVLENWHESKKKFSRVQIAEMIRKIERLGYRPTGFGRPTAGKAADTLSGELFDLTTGDGP